MLALSIRQPWAWAIINLAKDVENRPWNTAVRGTILIHTGKKIDWDGYDYLYDEWRVEVPEKLETGGIVGKVDIIDCVTASNSPWFFGPKGFVLKNAKSLQFMPVKGQLGFFDVNYTGEMV